MRQMIGRGPPSRRVRMRRACPAQTIATFIAACVTWYRDDAPKLLALREI